MDEMTIALDDLENAIEHGGAGFSYRNVRPQLDRLIEVLRSQQGDMARLAVVVENLELGMAGSGASVLVRVRPEGSVMTPGSRRDVTTLTGGNGVISPAGI